MPVCQMKTNYKMDEEKRREFLKKTAELVADIVEKPVPAVMVMMSDEHMYMNNSEDTVFFAEFRYVRNFSDSREKEEFIEMFADRMLTHIQAFTNVDPHRIYMQFTMMKPDEAWKYTKEERKLKI